MTLSALRPLRSALVRLPSRLLVTLMGISASIVVAAEPGVLRLDELRGLAEAGDGRSQLLLAMRYDSGDDTGGRRDLTQAFVWYQKAAERGYVEAQASLGLLFIKGEGVARNPGEAVKWFSKAAEQGHPLAQLNLGSCHANGEGVKRDMVVAASWYKEAAERHVAAAQYFLGLLYGRGEGVTQDYVQAYRWLHAAATNGIAAAVGSLDTLKGIMTPDQLTEANQLIATESRGLASQR